MSHVTPLKQAYYTESLWSRLSRSGAGRVSPSQKIDFCSESLSQLAKEIKKFSLSCIPLAPRKQIGLSWADCILDQRWIRSICSLLLYSLTTNAYNKTSVRDIERTRQLVERIACHAPYSWSVELRAFLIHQLMAYVVAYRSTTYFSDQNTAKPFFLPTWEGSTMRIKACRFDRKVNLCGGFNCKVFVPIDGKGSPTYLLHGTTSWGCHEGTGLAVTDDFNPLGPGDDIRKVARKRLHPLLIEQKKRYGEKPVFIGHSLGGTLSTAFAVDLSEHIHSTYAFSPTKSSYGLHRKWQRLQEQADKNQLLPRINTFVSSYDDQTDPITFLGDVWIGNVYQVNRNRPVHPFLRHVIPAATNLNFTLSTLDPEAINQTWWRRTRLWTIAQRITALMVYSILFPSLLFKRLVFGWESGGLWRYGILGVPVQALRQQDATE